MKTSKHHYNTAIIGNCSYIAHVNTDAEVVWLCLPHFDSSFVFGKMLDEKKGGVFSISPVQQYSSRQYYLRNTNVLCTEFACADGKFRVIDFAPRFPQYDRRYKPLMLVRKIEVLQGNPEVQVICEPKGDYGNITPQAELGSNHIAYTGLEGQLRLTTNASLTNIMKRRSFLLTENKYFALTWGTPLEAPLKSTVEDFLQKTIDYWHNWVLHCKIKSMWQEEVIRSALALKLHQYDDTGAIIAASTTSLPEHDQSGRNWDYRYCWMRDSYYTLKALNSLGHFEELERYGHYIQHIAARNTPRYNPVYSIHADEDFEERIVDLAGYLNNQPVRIGNQAKEHIQNDVYGQILVSLLPLYTDKRLAQDRFKAPESHLIYRLLQFIDKTMDEPDAGLWEFRNRAQRHCYTFLFHWAGACAAEKIGQSLQDVEMINVASKLRERAALQIQKCYKPEEQAYTQAIETNAHDASNLQLITMGYLDRDTERAKKHLEALERNLMSDEGLFYRYLHADDFGKPKSTFFVCTFWYIEALACVGRVEEASERLDAALKYANHVGLFSEDVDAADGSQWGNFPQTYSHVGLINSVFRIANRLDLPEFI